LTRSVKGGSTGTFKLTNDTGVDVDVFPAWINENGRVFIYPHTYGTVVVEDLLELCPWNDLPHTFVPSNPEPFLESNYGAGWRKPDPYFRFNWVRSKRKFQKFLFECEAHR